jgi:hypothetical protein
MGSARSRAERPAPRRTKICSFAPATNRPLPRCGVSIGGFRRDRAQELAPKPREDNVLVRNAIAPAALALASFAAPAHAGPCTDRIYQADLQVEKLIDAAAASGKPAAQSTFATLHRRPTPGTVASAEEKTGNLSSTQVEAITRKLDDARDADDKGDRSACETALNDAERMLSR